MRTCYRLHPAAALALALFAAPGSVPAARADLVAIGTVQALTPDAFAYYNSGSAATLTTSTAAVFRFADGLGLSTAGQAATLKFTAAALSPVVAAGPVLRQVFDGPTNVLTITRDSDGATLLALHFTGTLLGFAGGANAALGGTASAGDLVVLRSDFLDFSTTADRSFQLLLPTVTPALDVGNGGLLADFRSGGSLSFSAGSSGPTTAGVVPEPPGAILLVGGLASIALACQQRRRLATRAD